MDGEISKYLNQCNKIKLWGALSSGASEEPEVGSCYSLFIADGISMDLFESNFVISIGFSHAKELESYKLELSKLSGTFIKSEKHTQERYGMVYQMYPKEILVKIEEHLNKVNLNVVMEKKLLSCFRSMLERIIPDILVNGYYGYRFTIYYPNMTAKERKKYDEETNTYRNTRYTWEINDLRRTLERISVNKLFLSFIPYEQDLLSCNLPSIDVIYDLLINSDIFMQKNRSLKKVFNGELTIEKRENKLYLGFIFF